MVKHNGQWGTVCDDGISPGGVYDAKSVLAAHSACHTLGLSGGSITTTTGPEGPIWMDDVDCATSTTNFLTCSHRGWGVENCAHGEDVLLTCT